MFREKNGPGWQGLLHAVLAIGGEALNQGQNSAIWENQAEPRNIFEV